MATYTRVRRAEGLTTVLGSVEKVESPVVVASGSWLPDPDLSAYVVHLIDPDGIADARDPVPREEYATLTDVLQAGWRLET